MCTKRVAKKKYGLSIKDSRQLKNQSKNNNDNNNGDNNSNNANLARTLIFQVDTGKNKSLKGGLKNVECSLMYFLGDFSCSQWFCTFVRFICWSK